MIDNMGLKDTILNELYKYDYDLKDIGEKIRLFYVALTRAKEKMIIITSFNDSKICDEELVSDDIKLSINNFTDMLSIIKNDLEPYTKEVNLYDLDLSNEYNINNSNYLSNLTKEDKIVVDIIDEYVPINNSVSHFSKSAGLIDIKKKQKMDFGTKMHYYLEIIDFNKPDYSLIEDKYKEKIDSFLNSDLMANKSNGVAYKEYEFIYNNNNEEKHGFIDLLMEYDDHFDIIDYKLKNIDDEHYDEQLNGYREYIKSISNKRVNCFLYSIVDETYREVKQN